jgi:outer membrane protein
LGLVRVLSLLLAWISIAAAQQQPLTLGQAVQESLEKYPAVRVSLEQVSSAAAAINLARTSYLPRVDFLAQLNRATSNNIFGLLLPQSTIPSISGPARVENIQTNVWGSAVGLLVSWEPFDFGLRKANVDVADAARRHTQTTLERTRFEVETTAADAFLSVLAAQQTVVAARAGVARSKVLNEVVSALAKAELRPGADAARARAELALAETQLIQAEQAATVTRAALGQLLNRPAADVSAEPGPLLQLPPEATVPAVALAEHPLAREQQAVVDEVQARQKALDKSYYPKFNLQAASYARGSGAHPDFTTGGAAAGLGPNIHNWAVGMSVTFPIMDLSSLRAEKEIETHRRLSEAARYDQVLQDLNGRLEKAKALLDGARRVARNTPLQLEAATAAEQQATARYKSGLGNLIEVAEAQRLLTQTEIDDSLAKLNVWRGMLAVAAAEGDLEPFLKEAGK